MDIKFFYKISLAEGEGVGTAYEYCAKLRRLWKFIDAIAMAKRILIAGLPEKFGYSMDFILLSEILDGQVLVIDERADRIGGAQRCLRDLSSMGILSGTGARFSQVDDLGRIDRERLDGERFDLALSCEVLQRVNSSKEDYFSFLREAARSYAVFVPNGGNAAHADHSGLKGMHLHELLKYCRLGNSKMRIYDCGLLDMPPFPPGVSRSQERREQAAGSRLEGFLMKALELHSSIEGLFPRCLKVRAAHIAYLMAARSDFGKAHNAN
ncbi:MAG: hypothetical protein LAP85_06030 [Acidobacteriia bacterium]|nr:hypothetical protein [Terriglobia bacterium]